MATDDSESQRMLGRAPIDAWFDAGAYSAVAGLASAAARVTPTLATLAVIEKVAIACAIVGDGDAAERLFLRLLEAMPEAVAVRANFGVLQLKRGRYASARQELLEVSRREPDHPNLRFNLGLVEFALGDFRAASANLDAALRQDGNHPTVALYVARARIELGDYVAGRQLAEQIDARQILSVRERYELSQLYASIDWSERAEAVLRALLADDPTESVARVNLASLLERANQLDAAQALLDEVTGSERASANFNLVLGKLHAAAKRWEAALAAFDDARRAATSESRAGRDKLRSEIEFERAQVLDRLGDYDAALRGFEVANALIRDQFRALHPAVDSDGFRIDWLKDTPSLDPVVAAAGGGASRTRDEGASEDPVFLVGFPRSGTTLLDQMLDAHPGLQVMEEKPALEAVVQAVAEMDGGYPLALGALTDAQADALRDLYHREVGRHLERRPGTRLVDKYPFNLSRVHLILRLFPRAQWIFAIRHPCDVVLSCFMQNFRFTDSTHGFWSIDQTASIYVQIMSLWLEQRRRLAPDCIDVRYETLVEQFESEARRLIGFLQLPWDDRVLRYAQHARTRRISTPSYKQVVQPIYRSANGRWLNYRSAFNQAEPLLRPLIERLGYPVLLPAADSSGGGSSAD